MPKMSSMDATVNILESEGVNRYLASREPESSPSTDH